MNATEPKGTPTLERACELLWQAGHPRIAEALQNEVEEVVRDRDRLARILYPGPTLVAKEKA